LAERRNQTVLNMARSMLKEKNLPHSLWGEPVSTVAYILNKCQTKKLDSQVPEGVWTRRKPTVKHLRVFGSLCYKHVPYERRMKLEDKSESMILVGYHPTSAYRLLNPVTKKISISRDVIFNELSSWDWEKQCDTPFFPSSLTIDEEQGTESSDVKGEQQTQQSRPQRTRKMPSRFDDFEVELLSHRAITNIDEDAAKEEDFLHYAFMADVEPVDYTEAIKQE
jgi:hypothetical protein